MSYIAQLLALQAENLNGVEAAECRLPSPPAAEGAKLVLVSSTPPIAINPWQERAKMLRALSIPAEWIEGLIRLEHCATPPHLGEVRWAAIVHDADYMAREWGAKAHEFGWSTSELFGCAPGFARRVDCDGMAMLLAGRNVPDLNHEVIWIENRCGPPNRFRKKAAPEARPIWRAG
jgi:hypothetical protein